MTNKIKTIISIVAVLLLGITAFIISNIDNEPSEKQLEAQVFELKQGVIRGEVDIKTKNEKGFLIMSVVSVENFQITYQEEIDLFSIIIDTGGRDAEKYLTIQEIQEIRKIAEDYFLRQVLKTENKNLACKLNVEVTTIGYGASLPLSPLSFCDDI